MLLGQIVLGLASVLSAVFSLATFLVFVRVLFSWFRPNPAAGFLRTLVQGVYTVTDPPLDWLRRTLPFLVIDRFDLTPIAAIVGISLLRNVLVGSLTTYGFSLLAG